MKDLIDNPDFWAKVETVYTTPWGSFSFDDFPKGLREMHYAALRVRPAPLWKQLVTGRCPSLEAVEKADKAITDWLENGGLEELLAAKHGNAKD